MDWLVSYFSSIPSLHRALLLAGGIATFWVTESLWPNRDFHYNKWKHAGINIFFTLTTIVVNFLLAFLLLAITAYTEINSFGLLFFFTTWPFFLYTLIGLLLLDFLGAYLPHYLQHRVPLLWRVHLVHHTDMHVDTTTANRHHPLESVIRFAFTALGVFLLGAPIWLVFLYQAMSVIFAQFTHANISLHPRIDNVLRVFVVSPGMHRVHHHCKMPYTDSNYGNIFSIWDHLLGTHKKLDEQQLQFGLDTHLSAADNHLSSLMVTPFKPKVSYNKPTSEKK